MRGIRGGKEWEEKVYSTIKGIGREKKKGEVEGKRERKREEQREEKAERWSNVK